MKVWDTLTKIKMFQIIIWLDLYIIWQNINNNSNNTIDTTNTTISTTTTTNNNEFAEALIWAILDKTPIQLCHFLISHCDISHEPTFIVPFIFIKNK